MNTIPRIRIFRDPEFPLCVQRQQHPTEVGEHLHDFTELVLITGGSGIHVTRGWEHPIGAGEVFVISAGRSHGYRATENVRLFNVLFDLEQLRVPLLDLQVMSGYHALFTFEPAFRQHGRFSSRLRLAREQRQTATETLHRIEAEFQRQAPGWKFAANALFMQLVVFISRCYSEAPVPDAHKAMRLATVLSHLQQHYTHDTSLSQLAEMASMSSSSLLRAFRLVLGRSPIEYRIRFRVAKAAELLASGTASVKEVGQAVGFEDSNYFARQFRRVTGASPRDYRRRHCATL